MLQLKNHTPFEAAIALFPDEKGVDTLYIMVKATFSIGHKVEVAKEQVPIVEADEYWGEPGQSSLKNASEYHLMKPGTDIVMAGSSCAPGKKAVQMLDVMLSVGRYQKIVRVFGERRWTKGLVGLNISSPAPFDGMPLVYERAYGGIYKPEDEKKPVLYEPRNPVGIGFLGNQKPNELKGTLLPNVEDPAQLIRKPGDQPDPAGFSFVAPSWEPRIRYGGTYDEQWMKKRAPYLPEDFDPRFFNTAPEGLVCEAGLKGGEPVMITNMSPDGPMQFTLPHVEFDMDVRIEGNEHQTPLNLEMVYLEPNEKKMCLMWRAFVVCDKKALKVEEIHIEQKQLILA